MSRLNKAAFLRRNLPMEQTGNEDILITMSLTWWVIAVKVNISNIYSKKFVVVFIGK